MTPVSTNSDAARGPLVPSVVNAVPDQQAVAFLPLHIVVTTLVAVVGVGAIGLQLYESPESHDPIAVATGATAIGLIAYARYFLRLPWLSASVVYLMLFWMFHFGMTFTAAVFPSALLRLQDWQIEWFYWPNVRMAMILGLIGAAGFVFGVGSSPIVSRRARPTSVDGSEDRRLYIGGWLIMLVGIAASIAVVAVLCRSRCLFRWLYRRSRSRRAARFSAPPSVCRTSVVCWRYAVRGGPTGSSPASCGAPVLPFRCCLSARGPAR